MGRKIENKYVEHEDYVELVITSKKHGVFHIKLDSEDYTKVSKYHWSINAFKSNKGRYVAYYALNSKLGFLHRYIMNAKSDEIVDHIDGNNNSHCQDCRKANLRTCSQEENGKNRKMQTNNKSGRKGVIWYPYRGINKWMASICVNYKIINLGYYNTFNEAVKAREKAEEKYYGEYSRE